MPRNTKRSQVSLVWPTGSQVMVRDVLDVLFLSLAVLGRTRETNQPVAEASATCMYKHLNTVGHKEVEDCVANGQLPTCECSASTEVASVCPAHGTHRVHLC